MAVSINESVLKELQFSTLSNNGNLEAFNYDYKLLPEFMLTTIDNPFNPFTDFDSWYEFDESKGYQTCGLLARVSKFSSALSYEDQKIDAQLAIDTVLNSDPFGIYTVVAKPKDEN